MYPFISKVFLFAATSVATPVLKRQSDGNSTKTALPVTSATTLPSTDTSINAGGFCNTVFNTGASKNPGFPSTTWDSLTANGVSNFVAFCISPLDSCNNIYNLPSPLPPAMQAAQIPICMDPSKLTDCINLLQSDNPPAYMEIFNEPDYSYQGYTPLTSPEDAAASIQSLLPAVKNTRLISPAPAYTNSDYLSRFAAACNGCMDHIDIIAGHIYDHDPAGAIEKITTLHNTWPDKKLWLTEIAPASASGQGCTFDEAGMINYIETLLPQIKALGYVEKIFWNSGEHGELDPASPDVCNPSLTNLNGSATALLETYKQFC